MRNVSEAFAKAASTDGARYYSKCIVNGQEITDTLNDLKIEASSNGNGEITIGNAAAASISFFINNPTINLENQEITIYESAETDEGESEYIQIGVFRITKAEEKEERTDYTGYDGMYYLMEMPYASGLSYPAADLDIVKEICSQAGISFNDSTMDDKTVKISTKPVGYTKREMLGYLAARQGKNAIISADGILEFKWYKDSKYEINGNRYYENGLEFTTEKNSTVDKISCRVATADSTTTLESGTGINTISFENPFMTQAILDRIYQKIGGFTYRPLKVDFLGDWRVEVGDIVTVVSNGVSYKAPVMKISYECDGGLRCVIESYGRSETQNNINPTGPLTSQMQKYSAELAVINVALVNKLSANEADIRYLHADQLTAIEAEIETAVIANLQGKFASIEYLEANYAEINLANVQKESVGTLLANIGLITSATIENGHVTGCLDSVSINANTIKAGTLSVDRLVLNGTNESLIFALNNIGNLTSTHTDTIDGGLITERTITADHIVAHTITANELASKTITAANIASGTITSAEIAAGTITAAEIAAGTITSDKLNANEIFSNSAIINEIFAQDVTATGSITSPVLKSVDYVYGSGNFTTSGMIVDLFNKTIRTPNFYLKCAEAYNGEIATLGVGYENNNVTIAPMAIQVSGISAETIITANAVTTNDGKYSTAINHGIVQTFKGVLDGSGYYSGSLNGSQIYLSAVGVSDAGSATITQKNATFKSTEIADVAVSVENPLRRAGIVVGSSGGVAGLWDYTNQKWILYSNLGQVVNIPHNLQVTGNITATEGLYATNVTATAGSVTAATNVYAGATTDTVTRSVYARNSLRSVRLLANASGVAGLYDDTNAIFILQSSTAAEIQIGESSKTTAIVLSHTNGRLRANGNGMELYGGTPYIDFHFGGSTADYTSRLIESESGVLMSMGTLGTNKNIRFGWESASTTYAVTSKWKDGNQHNIVERNADGLSAYFGWAGSSTYLTRTVLRGRSIEFNTAGNIFPTNDNTNYLGDGTHRFKQLFAAVGSISTSDRNQKRNIEYDLDKMDAVFDALKPCSFYHIEGDRKHFGLIAQEAENALFGSGMSIDEIGLVCRDHLYEDGENGEKIYLYNTDGTPQYRYGLRYEELHGLEIWQIQQLKKRVSELESKLAAAYA